MLGISFFSNFAFSKIRKMEKPKISIIVPVYNVERYLRECLNSIKNQTFKEWECILVDDGSSDTSSTICDEYASIDSRFKSIHKSNGGQSSARNIGLRMAQADLIGFVDSDDWIEPEMFQMLYDLIQKYDADMSQVGYITEYIDRHFTKRLVDKTTVITGQEASLKFGFGLFPCYTVIRLHRKHILSCEFPEGRNFEDVYVYGKWLKNVKKMVMTPTPMYHYRMRKSSTIHSNEAINRYNFFKAWVDHLNMLDDILSEKQDICHKNAIIYKKAVNAAKLISRKESNIEQRELTIMRIGKEVKNYPLPSVKYMGLKSKWRALMLINHPKFFSSLMRLVNIFIFDIKYREKKLFE